MRRPAINIYATPAKLAAALALQFRGAVKQAADAGEIMNIAVSGGNTPRILFEQLAMPPLGDSIPWKNVRLFWCDERCVPPDDAESNFGMAQRLLLSKVKIPGKNIQRIRGEKNPVEEATRYSQVVAKYAEHENARMPRFDWILLGMGIDGHTASLFPQAGTLLETGKIYDVAVHPQTGQQRITLTLPVINNAVRVTFLVIGEKKAVVVGQIINREGDYEQFPAAMVHPANGVVEWWLDNSAALSLMA